MASRQQGARRQAMTLQEQGSSRRRHRLFGKCGRRTAAVPAGVGEGGQAGHNRGCAHGPGAAKALLAAGRLAQHLPFRTVVADVGQVAGRKRVHLLGRDAVRPLLQQRVALCGRRKMRTG